LDRPDLDREDRVLTPYTGTHLVEVLLLHERSQRWLSRKMGVNYEHLNRVVNGHLPISVGFVRRTCAVLGLPAASLFFVQQPMHAYMTERETADVA
jgi:plasmid maintenance system antidote protein VapI